MIIALKTSNGKYVSCLESHPLSLVGGGHYVSAIDAWPNPEAAEFLGI